MVELPVEAEVVLPVAEVAEAVPVLVPDVALVAETEPLESDAVGSLSAPTTPMALRRPSPESARFLIIRLSPAWSRGV